MRTLSRLFILGAMIGSLFCLSWAEPDPLGRLHPTHPRLFVRDFDFAKQSPGDPLQQALRAHLLATAEAMLPKKAVEYFIPDGLRLLAQSRLALQRISTLSMAYRLSGDERFRDRAVREMLTVCAFPDWNPKHFLDVGEMSMAVSIGYDWLYDTLKEDERAIIRRSLEEKALSFAQAAYVDKNSGG